MYWIGSKSAIDAAEAQVAAIVTARPAYCDGQLVPNPTECWDLPRATQDPSVWAISAYEGMAPPPGCQSMSEIIWPA